VFGETLDLSRFSGPKQEAILRTFVQQKYSDVRFGVVLAVGASAFDLVSRWRSELWPDVPVIFAAIDEMSAAQLKLDSNTTGLIMRRRINSMMSIARILVPGLEGVAVVGGRLERDAYRREYLEDLPALATQTKLINLTGQALPDQLRQVASLPDKTAILYTSLFIDDADTRYSPEDALVAVASVAKRPIVIDVESQIGLGAAGGYVLDNVAYGQEVAALGRRVLDGESADAIPVAVSEFTQPIFDWRQLNRWGINESTLPQGSEIRYRPQPLWEQYRWQIAVTASALLALTLLIFGFFYERQRQRLRENEERFRGIYENTATGIAITGTEGFQSCNPAYSAMLGYSEQELRKLTYSELIHPADREVHQSAKERLDAGEVSSFEIVNRYIGKGGTPIWVHKHVSLLRGSTGRPANTVTLVTDMSERKRQEDQIRFLMREVNHRSKNLLSVVQAIARQTASANLSDFLTRFEDRIGSLAASQDLLVKNDWKGAELHELARSQLAHFEDLVGTRIEFKGPPLFVSAQAAQVVGMALHELATNASKYGALSNRGGRVGIEWGLERTEEGKENFQMSWRESGVCLMMPPSGRGFGLSVLCEMAEFSLSATVELDFAATGLCWRLQCPSSEIAASGIPTRA
jgi:PAS domain S-box-containing protein